jgi:tetratricopeptide (TPR) repeat protein
MKVAQAQNDHFRVFELYDYIEQLNIHTPRKYERKVVLMVSPFIERGSAGYKKHGLEVIKRPLREMAHSSRFQDIYARAQAYTALADQDNKEYFELAEEDYELLIEQSPERAKHYIGYAKMWAKKGEYNKAFKNYEKALGALPSLRDPRINRDHSQVVKYKKYRIRKGEANIYFFQGEYQKAEKHYRLAFANDLSDITLYKKIADTYYKRGKLERAIEYNQKGYRQNPEDPSWPFSIALLYKKKGEKNKALQYGKEALELSPEDEQIQKFVEKLK